MSTEATTLAIEPGRIRELTERESKRLEEATQGSRRMYERAHKVLPLGVPSSYHARDPWPIYIERGEGAVVWDVDGRELWDFHNGFGSMVMGHAHPAIVEAISERARLGTHFSAPTEDGIVVAEELARRFGLPKWRFTNSGSEATMDAIRIARGLKGRDTILKIFGSYHGHHDGVMVSVGVGVDWREFDPDDIPSFPYGGGIPHQVADLTVAVPFNDAERLERRIVELTEEGWPPACLIMEAAMMNLGVVLPEAGYLEAVREITKRHDVVLIFDEVKTGLAIAAGGATERFGVQPDMVTLAKTLGAGLPSGAIGATDEVMEVVESEKVFQVGTFNGNPLTMAAARAGLLDVLTPEAYQHLDRINDRLVTGCQEIVERYRLPAYTVGISSKGCVMFSDTKIVDYETFMTRQNVEVTELAWLYNLNRGIFATPGREEEWTLSVSHTEEAADAFIAVFEELAADLTA
jgi:glutamate-1-semialdehyde 2,1-aminomutase